MSVFLTKPDVLLPLDLAVFPSALGKTSPQSIKIQHPLWKVWRYICKMVWWNLILLKYMQHLQDCQIKCFHSIQLAECFIFFSFLLFFFNKYPYFPWTARLSSGKRTSLVYLGFPISSSTLRLMSGVPAKLPSLLVEKKSLPFRYGGFLLLLGISITFFSHKFSISKRIGNNLKYNIWNKAGKAQRLLLGTQDEVLVPVGSWTRCIAGEESCFWWL